MTGQYFPPALVEDFESSAHSQTLQKTWSAKMHKDVTSDDVASPAFFDATTLAPGAQTKQAAPVWKGLPNKLIILAGDDVVRASQVAETLVTLGSPDPSFPDGTGYSAAVSIASGQPVPYQYRPQDEYLEWAVFKGEDGVISSVEFTCEGPEYWSLMADVDMDLVCRLYRGIIAAAGGPDQPVDPQQLQHQEAIGYEGRRYPAGSYNPFNALNLRYAVHLTHPSNTLGAEITLARQASQIWSAPSLSATDLCVCSGYGDPNRASDPTIGAGVNAAVRGGSKVTLRNPIGLYIQSLDDSSFGIAGESLAGVAGSWFAPLRPDKEHVTDMVLRARFAVPAGFMRNGKQIRVGDLSIDETTITTGGQIAHYVAMTLYALAISGAPHQDALSCNGVRCPGGDPDYVTTAKAQADCMVPPSPAAMVALSEVTGLDTHARASRHIASGTRGVRVAG